MNLFELMTNNPIAMGVIQNEVTKAVATVQSKDPNADGGAKEAAALQLTYDALDMLIGFPGPVDQLMKAYVIPHIPAMIKWAVDEFKKIGWPE